MRTVQIFTATYINLFLAGIWGVFWTQDVNCGVPPCPDSKVVQRDSFTELTVDLDMAWNYLTAGCANCTCKTTQVFFKLVC